MRRPLDPTQTLLRQPRFESFEDRLAMSAQPAAPLPLPLELDAARDLQTQATRVASAAADVHNLTGVNYARNNFGLDGRGQTVAVIDSGIAYDHTALGNGYGAGHRVVGGWDFAENDADPYDDAPAGFHGTHVAGIIGSSDAAHRGVAPGADLVALRVMDDQGNGDFTWVASALQWVHDHRNDFRSPITTVNLSLGTTWNSSNVPNWAQLEAGLQQLKSDGMFIAVSAGNSFTTSGTSGLSYPAASPYVVPVASVDADGQLSSFSQRSSRTIAAPGRNITSTVPSAIFGNDGGHNDFAASSGTSMAAPYVAGAATLIREAMQSVGATNINQDSIYAVMRSTADSVFDSVTGASYLRLNVQHAIDAILPADDFGSTAATAFSLGTITSGRSLNGIVNRVGDLDYFSFTAGATGTARFTSSGDADLNASWQRVGGGASANGNALAFEVVAGQNYTVALGNRGGFAHYTVQVDLQSSVDWGSISFLTLADQNLRGGDNRFQFQAARDGRLTVQASFSQTAGDIDLELYDSRGVRIATSKSAGGVERIDVDATAGQSFSLRVTGSNRDVDFRLANLVTSRGNTVDVFGTKNSDTFAFQAGATQRVTVNGIDYFFTRAAATKFRFHGGDGKDSIVMTGTSANETATLRVGTVSLVGSGYRADGDGLETIRVVGGGGQDLAKLYDSPGDDIFAATPTAAQMQGTGFSNTVDGFATVIAYATQAGTDRAQLDDSAGDDVFTGLATISTLRGNGFSNTASGFEFVSAYARHGGHDVAHLYAAPGGGVAPQPAAPQPANQPPIAAQPVATSVTVVAPPGPVYGPAFGPVAPPARSLQDFLSCPGQHAEARVISQVRAAGFETVTGDLLAGAWTPPESERTAVDRVFEQIGARH